MRVSASASEAGELAVTLNEMLARLEASDATRQDGSWQARRQSACESRRSCTTRSDRS